MPLPLLLPLSPKNNALVQDSQLTPCHMRSTCTPAALLQTYRWEFLHQKQERVCLHIPIMMKDFKTTKTCGEKTCRDVLKELFEKAFPPKKYTILWDVEEKCGHKSECGGVHDSW